MPAFLWFITYFYNFQGESLIFEFDLLSVEQPGEYSKQVWTMSTEEKRALSAELREKGSSDASSIVHQIVACNPYSVQDIFVVTY